MRHAVTRGGGHDIRAASDLWRIERNGSLPTCPPSPVRAAHRDHPVRSIERSSPPIGRRFDAGELAGAWLLPRSDRTRVSIEQAEEARHQDGDVPGRPGPVPPARGRSSGPPSSPWWAAGRTHRRLLIVQIDGLSRAVLERATGVGAHALPRRLLARHGYRLEPMSVGLPTSTPAFQMAAMYGVRPDIPGFHYYDRQRRRRHLLPAAGPRGAGRGQAGGGPARHPARRQRVRLRLHRRRRQQPLQLRQPHAAHGPWAALRALALRGAGLGVS